MIPTFIYVKWCLLLLLFGGIFWWTAKQDNGWAKRINAHNTMDKEHRALHQALQMRGHSFLAILAIIITITLFLDVQMTQQSPADDTSAEQEEAAANAPPVGSPTIDTTDSKAASREYTVATLFAEDSENGSDTSSIDGLKRHFEEMVVSYYYLQRCNMADATLLADIQASLQVKIRVLGADSTDVERAVLSAAKGTYDGLYANARCNDTQGARLKAYITQKVSQ